MITIEQLEAARVASKMSRTEMARKLRLRHPNNYHNWVYRNSIPKEYIPSCEELYQALQPKDSTAANITHEGSHEKTGDRLQEVADSVEHPQLREELADYIVFRSRQFDRQSSEE